MENRFDIQKIKQAFQHPLIKNLLRFLQFVAVLAVLYYMAQKLGRIGWDDVSKSLPVTPWFYLIFLAWYFALPIGEWFTYQVIWGQAVRKRFDVFVRSRIYNLAIVSYMGEAFIALWAHQSLQIKGRAAISAVKDSNILSALASNSLTVILLAAFFLTGQLEVLTDADPAYGYYIGLSVVLGMFLVPLVLRYHARILDLPPEKAKHVFFIHVFRLLSLLLLQAGQWAVVFPDVPFDTWLLLLTAQMVLTRVPFLPNTDLLFAGLGITLITYVDGPAAQVAGMFVAAGALNQILNLVFFIITSFTHKRPVLTEPQKA